MIKRCGSNLSILLYLYIKKKMLQLAKCMNTKIKGLKEYPIFKSIHFRD